MFQGTKKIETVEDKNASNSQALAWIAEMELISDPNFLNAVILNIFKVSNRIKDVQLIMDSVNKKMLVWLEVDWLGRKFGLKNTTERVFNMLESILPSYKFRITFDKNVFDKSLEITKRLKNVGTKNNK